MTIYIAGPMTGIEQDNLPAFEKAKAFFEAKGFDVIIPHDLAKANPNITEYGALLALDIFHIGTKAHLVAMLPHWELSRGAVAEYVFSRAARKTIIDATNGYPLRMNYPLNMMNHSVVDECNSKSTNNYKTT